MTLDNQPITRLQTQRNAEHAAIGIPGDRLRRAGRVLRAGGVVSHATEGVWGLACDPSNEKAIRRILALKKRAATRGLIVVAADPTVLAPFVASEATESWQRAQSNWPGPVTWLLPVASGVCPLLSGGGPRIALRISAHPLCRALARVAGGAIVSTSANIAGRPAPVFGWQMRRSLNDGVDFVVGGHCQYPGTPSTIRDGVSGETIRGNPNA